MPEVASTQAATDRRDLLSFACVFVGHCPHRVGARRRVLNSISARLEREARRNAKDHEPRIRDRLDIGNAVPGAVHFLVGQFEPTVGAGAPPGALEMHVVAKQWMWKTQHANGAREIDELHVPIGVPVRLVMTSQDVIHSFFIPAFRMKKDVLPGRYTETWFNATKLGVFHLFCAEFCGTDHSGMTGRIVVMPQDEYGRWQSAQPQGDDLAKEGEVVFRARGCSGCHAEASLVHAPKLRGLYGRSVQLADGRTVIADDAYLRDSMLLPKRDVTAGYEPIMPSYTGILTEGEIQSLTAYIRSLSTAEGDRR